MKPGPSSAIRVVIIDDSVVVRVGLQTLLSAEMRLSIVGEAESVVTAIQIVENHRQDVVLLDIRLPDGTGFDACRQILQKAPDTRVLFLTSVVDDRLVEEALRAGGHGYLLKEINGPGLIQAIFDVAGGKSILDPAVTARVMNLVKNNGTMPTGSALKSLSPQERRVLTLVADGSTNKEVANKLNLTEKTVKNYLANVFGKLNVSRRSHAAALFIEKQPRP